MACLTSYIHTCTHTNPFQWKWRNNIYIWNAELWIAVQKFYTRGRQLTVLVFLMNFGDPPLLICPTLGSHTDCKRVLSLNPLLWNTCGSRALVLKKEKRSEKNGRDPHFCSFPKCQVTPGPWVPQTLGVTMNNTTASYQAPSMPSIWAGLRPQQLNIQFDSALGQQEELHSFSHVLPVLFAIHSKSC